MQCYAFLQKPQENGKNVLTKQEFKNSSFYGRVSKQNLGRTIRPFLTKPHQINLVNQYDVEKRSQNKENT